MAPSSYHGDHTDDDDDDDDGDYDHDNDYAGGGFGENELDPPLEEECFVGLPLCQVKSPHTSGFLCTQSGEREKLHTICVIYLFVHNLDLFVKNQKKQICSQS